MDADECGRRGNALLSYERGLCGRCERLDRENRPVATAASWPVRESNRRPCTRQAQVYAACAAVSESMP